MQVKHLTDEARLDTDSLEQNGPLRVVIAYGDLAAGQRAMHMLAHLVPGLRDGIEFEPLPWSFDLLADIHWSEVAATDACNADILIIATNRAGTLPAAVECWLKTTIAQLRGTTAAVVALLGSEENPDGAGSSRLETIQEAARRAGLHFFAPAPPHELDEAIALIHHRAEMVTPVLDEMLHPHPHRAERKTDNVHEHSSACVSP